MHDESRNKWGVVGKLGLVAVFAAVTAGCGKAPQAGSKQSVTVKLAPPRPYRPEPGFSLATDLPQTAGAKMPPRR